MCFGKILLKWDTKNGKNLVERYFHIVIFIINLSFSSIFDPSDPSNPHSKQTRIEFAIKITQLWYQIVRRVLA